MSVGDQIQERLRRMPPWNLIGRVLAQTRHQKARLVIVTPVWSSQVSGDADRHPKADSTEGESDSTITPRSDARCDTPASRVDYLRGRYRECQLSEEASKLLLASWREKSSKSYDSLFRKWLSWCNERNSDPVSGPIGEVVNFLADLFKKGYQYRSLNAYRSAISSVHDKADGYEVGQHPLVTRLLRVPTISDHHNPGIHILGG